MVSRIFYVILLLTCLEHSFAEQPFCDNKCFGEGVTIFNSCYCDKACSVYKDCCSDSKYFDSSKESSSSSLSFSCKHNALVVDSCLPEWKGPDFIMKSCTVKADQEVDPVGNAPVTSRISGVTYSNYYCAICNGDTQNATVWNIKVSCPLLGSNLPVDKEEAFKHIFYNLPTKEWGYVLLDDSSKKLSFHACAVISEVPDLLSSKVRKCTGDEINTCDATWKSDMIKQMCDAYTDPVYHNTTKYKNFYCAICNHVDQSLLSCGDGIGPRSNTKPEPEENNKLSFSLLLDINFSEGNIVGKRLSAVTCLPGEIFDPFARRCRNIVCAIPGYVLRNGMCTASTTLPP